MQSITNLHVAKDENIGDEMSSPMRYFQYPGHITNIEDIRGFDIEAIPDKSTIILGGGGLLFERFLDNIQTLKNNSKSFKLVAWGIGQQIYGRSLGTKSKAFNYNQYLQAFDLIGIRDDGVDYKWVPCASCMHPLFDKEQTVKHEFIIFSHKKFQLKIDNFPRMTNDAQSFEEVLAFLSSGDTVLTSSFHGAYWATLLGKKVIAFPFSSKFHTLRHKVSLYPASEWKPDGFKISVFNRKIYEFKYKNKYSTPTHGWQDCLSQTQAYPHSLQESRQANIDFHQSVMNLLSQ